MMTLESNQDQISLESIAWWIHISIRIIIYWNVFHNFKFNFKIFMDAMQGDVKFLQDINVKCILEFSRNVIYSAISTSMQNANTKIINALFCMNFIV